LTHLCSLIPTNTYQKNINTKAIISAFFHTCEPFVLHDFIHPAFAQSAKEKNINNMSITTPKLCKMKKNQEHTNSLRFTYHMNVFISEITNYKNTKHTLFTYRSLLSVSRLNMKSRHSDERLAATSSGISRNCSHLHHYNMTCAKYCLHY